MSKQRWKDTLPSADKPTLVDAADNIALALVAYRNGHATWKRYAAWAAAHIRAYRKSLGVKSERFDWTESSRTDEEPLWRALTWVTWAARHESVGFAATCCRMAEADLRELWKRGQA